MPVSSEALSSKPYPDCTSLCEHWLSGQYNDCRKICSSKFSTREELEKKPIKEI